jgi:hypothetical protein
MIPLSSGDHDEYFAGRGSVPRGDAQGGRKGGGDNRGAGHIPCVGEVMSLSFPVCAAAFTLAGAAADPDAARPIPDRPGCPFSAEAR